MTRYVVIGAGAVGGTIAGRLAHAGRDVAVVARGDHLRALQAGGLHLRTPDFEVRLPVQAAAGPEELPLRSDDVLILTTKTHQAADALGVWADAPVFDGAQRIGTAGASLPVLTALNGVASESIALRFFDRVFGVAVWLPAVHLTPGEVIARGTPQSGTLHLSRVPASVADDDDAEFCRRFARELGESGLRVETPPDVMPWKYRKLISNIGNAFQALLGPGQGKELVAAARAEAREVLAQAGIEVTSDEAEGALRGRFFTVAPVPGAPTELGGSSWQSLARGSGSIETDYLNGEIALIARQHGLNAPINAAVTTRARRAAREGTRPGEITAAELAADVGREGQQLLGE